MTSRMFVMGGVVTVLFSLICGVMGYNEKFAGGAIGVQLALMVMMVFVFEAIKVGSICILTNGRNEAKAFKGLMVVLYLATAGSAGWGTYNFLANKTQGDTKEAQTGQAELEAAERRLANAERALASNERNQAACSSLRDEDGTRAASCLRRLTRPLNEARAEHNAANQAALVAKSKVITKTDEGFTKLVFALVAALVELAALGFFWAAKPRKEIEVDTDAADILKLQKRIAYLQKRYELLKQLATIDKNFHGSEEMSEIRLELIKLIKETKR